MLAASSVAVTMGLLVTFLGVGVVVNGLIAYIVIQGLGERRENRRHREGDTAV